MRGKKSIGVLMQEIELNLGKHCIETAIKRLHNTLLSDYFRKRKGDVETEEKLAMLQNALKAYDFPFLRSVHRELAGKSDARIVLAGDGEEIPSISIDGRIIDTEQLITQCKKAERIEKGVADEDKK